MQKTYLVECFCPGVTPEAHAEAVARATTAVRSLQARGRNIRFIDGLLVLADEVAFYRFAATTLGDVKEASSMAQLRFERILEYIKLPLSGLIAK